MTGINPVPGTIVFVYPGLSGTTVTANTSAGATRGSDTGQNGHTDDTHDLYTPYCESLEYEDTAGQGNFFEACLLYNGTYYPGGGTQTYSSAMAVLKAFSSTLYWYYPDIIIVGGSSQPAQQICYTPGPAPAASF